MTFKKIFLISVSVLIAVGVCGCTIKNDPYKIEEQTCAYMREKYHQEFQMVSYASGSIDVSFDEISLHSEKFPEADIKVYRDRKADGSGFAYSDNYYGFLVHDAYNEKLHSIIAPQKEQCKFFFSFTASYYPDALNASVGLEEALSKYSESLFTNIFVYIPESDADFSEETWNSIKKELQENKMPCFFAAYVLDEADYDSLCEENYKEYLSKHYKLKSLVSETVR